MIEKAAPVRMRPLVFSASARSAVRLIVRCRLIAIGLLTLGFLAPEKAAQFVLDRVFADSTADESQALFDQVGVRIGMFQRFFRNDTADNFVHKTHGGLLLLPSDIFRRHHTTSAKVARLRQAINRAGIRVDCGEHKFV